MARIWDHTPGLTFSDGGNFTFGMEFVGDVPITVEGVWYYGRPTGAPTVNAVSLYDAVSQVQLADGPGGSLVAGAWNFFAFTTPYNGSDNTAYAGAVEVGPGDYGYDLDGSLPVTSPDGHVEATQGRYLPGSHGFPSVTWTGVHGVDIEYELTPTDPSAGTAAGTVGVDLAVAGSRASAAAAAGTVGVDLAVAGSRAAAGSVPLAVGARLLVAGSRAATGAARPQVGVRLVVAGWSTDPGRPVTPFAAGRSVRSFPAGRPVRSFSEVPT